MLKKTILLGAAVYFLFYLIEIFFLLTQGDLSLQPLCPISPVTSPSPIVLVTYADGHPVFYQNQNIQAYSALNKGIDHIFCYKRSLLDAHFLEKNKAILEHKKGAGYWLWKPYIIEKTLQSLPDNAIAIYADSSTLFLSPILPLAPLFEKYDVLLLKNGSKRKGVLPAGKVIKREALAVHGMDTPVYRAADSLWGCLVIVKNSPRGRRFVQKWREVSENPIILTDEPLNKNYQHPEFYTHSHDQASLFITAHLLPEGVYHLDGDEIKGIFRNVHRHPHEAYKSLMPDMFNAHKIAAYGYNASFIQWLRKTWHHLFLAPSSDTPAPTAP